MTVRDFIAALSHFDGDLPVFVTGYEFGLHDAAGPRHIAVARNWNGTRPRYGGPHAAGSEVEDHTAVTLVPGVLLDTVAE